MSTDAVASDPAPTDRTATGRIVAAVLTAAYGVTVAVVNVRNGIVTSDFTPRGEWVLFGGTSGFPDDFGRNVFAGSVALGVLIVGLGVLVAVWGGTRRARPLGIVTAVLSVVLVLMYRDDGNLLGARPAAAAVLLAVALYLMASSLSVRPHGREG